ncbi:dihydroorotase [Halorubrum laminariae]|uniref:Dihydroorotase family protein n=1 Tax=Halorubrum laminariae TaxID=1433523 RepID=A0ABD6C0R6_9EURY|nr:amidohydrolase family protein [Halorubrum laminariae]
MVVDSVITGGTLVTADGTVDAGLAIDDGTIVEVGVEGSLPDAAETIDASGQLVLPGVVDPHVHIDDHVSLDTYQTATSAAALGGVTTFIDFAWQGYVGEESRWDEPTRLSEGVEAKRSNAGEALIDFGLHGGILSERSEIFDEMSSLVDEGITSFKVYTAYEFGLSNGFIHEVMDAASDLGAVTIGHTEEGDTCERLTETLKRHERSDPSWYPLARPDYTEATAAETLARYAREIGAKYYGVHTSCAKSADVFERYIEDGSLIRAETCTHYTTLTDDVYETQGQLPVIAPPIRGERDVDALFEALATDTLSVVSTDHVAQTQEAKTAGHWWDGPFGANSVQRSLPVFHDVAVNERGFSYPFLVRKMCTAPAETFGLESKGTLDPGTDADIVLFDPDESWTISAETNASRADYSIYEGREVTGQVTRTLVRGETVAEDGSIVGDPGHGEFVARSRPNWSV